MGRSTYVAQNAPGSRDVRDSKESGTIAEIRGRLTLHPHGEIFPMSGVRCLSVFSFDFNHGEIL